MLLKVRTDASSINQTCTSLSSFRYHPSLNHPAGMQRQIFLGNQDLEIDYLSRIKETWKSGSTFIGKIMTQPIRI